jgi:enoyl-[acyl-carrier protein] reductase I
VTYLNDKAKKYVDPLARELDAPIMMPLDARVPGQMEAVFDRIARDWGNLDFAVHSIAFSPKDALQARVVDVSREGFLTTMDVSCWTFIRMAHLAEPLMRKGGTSWHTMPRASLPARHFTSTAATISSIRGVNAKPRSG